MTIDAVLTERGNTHGDFNVHAQITQDMKRVIYTSPNYLIFTPSQREALEMIVHKIGRICAGNPNHHDHWCDLEGYARLVSRQLEVTPTPPTAPAVAIIKDAA